MRILIEIIIIAFVMAFAGLLIGFTINIKNPIDDGHHNHKFGKWEPYPVAFCAPSVELRTCTNCGFLERQNIPDFSSK